VRRRTCGAVATPLPAGFRIEIDADTKQLDGVTLFGGSPARVMRLSAAGLRAWSELREGQVRSAGAGALARKLTDAGMAHPRPPELAGPLDVVVVIPVRDRPVMPDRCLTALGRACPVVVIDDGSLDPRALVDVTVRHAAELVRRPDSGGPAAARNAGLAHVSSEFVAFLDSDCIPPSDWIERLAPHFADPLVAAAAPRVTAAPSATSAGRYSVISGSLDLGERAARVVPATRVAYVPTAALIVRRSALDEVADGTDVFDPGLRCGEDVDLVWRLHEAGWRIRYDPAVRVYHQEPDSWPALLVRRFRYGTSAAPLAQRHPTAMAPLVLHPWPAVTVASLLARRPTIGGLGFAASVLSMIRIVRRAGLPPKGVLRATLTAAQQTWLGVGRYATQFGAPLLAAGLLAPAGRTPRRRWGRRAAIASLLVGPPLRTWMKHRPELGILAFLAGSVADDVAYGTGVYAGCVRNRTTTPIRPTVSWRPFHLGPNRAVAAERAATDEASR
jgi:mycofactocin system glycosyltransferase